MNSNSKRVPAEFGPDIGFAVKPNPSGGRQERAFKRLKLELLFGRLDEVLGPGFNHQIRRAASEAEAIAWATPFPLLVFPALFAEKADAAAAVYERQQQILETSRDLLTV